MTVISLAQKKTDSMPHTYGMAMCLDCKHEWEAIAPQIGEVIWLECPECGLIRGRFKYQHERDGEQWVCNCGNDLFHIKPQGCYCPNCGSWQDGF